MLRNTSISSGWPSPDSSRPISCMMISVSLSRDRWLSASASSSLAQLGVVGQLPVEAEREPLVLLQMLPLERLGIVQVLGPAGGVAHVADRRPAGVLLHQALELAAVAHAKDFADAAQVLVGVEELVRGRG